MNKRAGANRCFDIFDDYTCSHQHGFIVCGMNLKNPITGSPRSVGKVGKKKLPKNLDEAEDYIEKFFCSNKGKFDKEAVQYVQAELKKMLVYFQQENVNIIRGMSVLIVTESA